MTAGMLRKELRKTRRGLASVVRELNKLGDDKPIIIIGEPPTPSPRVAGNECMKSIWLPGAQPTRKRLAYALRYLGRDLGKLARYLDAHR